MTTKDFIRHHTQLILEAEKKAEPVKANADACGGN